MRLFSRILPISAVLLAALAVAPSPAVAEAPVAVGVPKLIPVSTGDSTIVAMDTVQLSVLDIVLKQEFVDVPTRFVLRPPSTVPTLIDAINETALRPGRLFVDKRQRNDRLLSTSS